jgi:hypothetical protein
MEWAHVPPPEVELELDALVLELAPVLEAVVVELVVEVVVVVLPELAAVVLELELLDAVPLDDEALVDMLPHTLVFGTHALMWRPLASATSMHVRPAAQAAFEQSGAQYSSPPNCPQSKPAPQSESCKQGTQEAEPPPVPVPDDVEPWADDDALPVLWPVEPVVRPPWPEVVALPPIDEPCSPPVAHAARPTREMLKGKTVRAWSMGRTTFQRER